METHQLEPELQGRIPRSIAVRQQGARAGMGCLRVFLIPFILVGLYSFYIATQGSFVTLTGMTVPAQVTTREDKSDSDSSSYHINYTYQKDGITYFGSNQVSRDEYNATHEGDRVNVKILPTSPGTSPMLMEPGLLSSNTKMMWLFTSIWNAIIGLFVWFAFADPFIVKQLYIHGQISVAELVEKTVSSGEDSNTYFLHYVFEVPEGQTYTSGLIRSKCTVNQSEWQEAQLGQKYTVLYRPDKPKRSILYPFGPYRVL